MGIELYCGVSEAQWNHHPVAPGRYACIAPVYGRKKKEVPTIRLPEGTTVILDSGAFSDNSAQRLTFEAALARQVEHAQRYNYWDVTDGLGGYDLLIDESWELGERYKRRWSENDAWEAVKTTIAAAKWMAKNRPENKGLIQSAQGVEASQYLTCTEHVIDYIDPERDWLGLGGWCITGLNPNQVLPAFYVTIPPVLELAAKRGVKRVHVWGVCFAKALACLLYHANEFGLTVSTDSSGPSVKPVMGDWGYAEWRDNNYKRVAPELRGLERARHVALTREWLGRFETTPRYLDYQRKQGFATNRKQFAINREIPIVATEETVIQLEQVELWPHAA